MVSELSPLVRFSFFRFPIVPLFISLCCAHPFATTLSLHKQAARNSLSFLTSRYPFLAELPVTVQIHTSTITQFVLLTFIHQLPLTLISGLFRCFYKTMLLISVRINGPPALCTVHLLFLPCATTIAARCSTLPLSLILLSAHLHPSNHL